MSTIRLDKYLSDAGVGTRSQVKSYIRKGLVTVNGYIVKQPELKINTGQDIITFKNDVIALSDFDYYILNKPAGYVSATRDNLAPTVLSLLDTNRKDLFPVGRLDKDTEGLLLISNDGTLAHRLLSPRSHVDKTYYAVLDGCVTESDVILFASGVEIGDEDLDTAMPARLEILASPLKLISSYYNENVPLNDSLGYVMITIQEGKYHQVKRMFQSINRKVLYLRRMSFGPITLSDELAPGQYRRLSDEEIARLLSARHFNDLKC